MVKKRPFIELTYVEGAHWNSNVYQQHMLLKLWKPTFMESDHEIISMVILLPSAESFKKGFC